MALKRSRNKRKQERELWASYGLEMPAKPRYSGLGGILWFVTSVYVRQTEFEEYGGACVDNCGVKIDDWRDADCGHFRSAKSLATRFLRENLGLQRKHCNSPRGGNGNQYAFGLEIDRRYGKGTADRLTALSKTTSAPFKKDWYDSEIRRLLAITDIPEDRLIHS